MENPLERGDTLIDISPLPLSKLDTFSRIRLLRFFRSRQLEIVSKKGSIQFSISSHPLEIEKRMLFDADATQH